MCAATDTSKGCGDYVSTEFPRGAPANRIVAVRSFNQSIGCDLS
jgi:hypothetical protein